jgi:hypothetical protein
MHITTHRIAVEGTDVGGGPRDGIPAELGDALQDVDLVPLFQRRLAVDTQVAHEHFKMCVRICIVFQTPCFKSLLLVSGPTYYAWSLNHTVSTTQTISHTAHIRLSPCVDFTCSSDFRPNDNMDTGIACTVITLSSRTP